MCFKRVKTYPILPLPRRNLLSGSFLCVLCTAPSAQSAAAHAIVCLQGWLWRHQQRSRCSYAKCMWLNSADHVYSSYIYIYMDMYSAHRTEHIGIANVHWACGAQAAGAARQTTTTSQIKTSWKPAVLWLLFMLRNFVWDLINIKL